MAAHDTTRGRIGPNAIIQTVAALRERMGRAAADAALREWDHADLAVTLPDAMVPEEAFNRLTRSVFHGLGEAAGREVLERAGALTAEYLLAHRIPRLARLVLPRLPSRLALRILTRAIGGHAWTFAGNGVFVADLGATPAFRITGCPMCRGLAVTIPTCTFYRGTFEGLLRRLVHAAVVVEERTCEARGGEYCEFVLRI